MRPDVTDHDPPPFSDGEPRHALLQRDRGSDGGTLLLRAHGGVDNEVLTPVDEEGHAQVVK